MKKYLGWLAVMMLAVFTLSACTGGKEAREAGEERDLSTPSSRIVGHWKFIDEPVEHCYGEIDKETREGEFTTWRPETGETGPTHTYKIIEEDLMNNSLTLWIRDSSNEYLYIVDLDGISMKRPSGIKTLYFAYIDDDTDCNPEN